MRYPKVTVEVELLPINPENMREEDRTEERYLEIIENRCKPENLLSGIAVAVNQIFWDSTMKAEFPDGWNRKES